MLSELLTLFSFEFMQRAFLGGTLFALTAPLVGQFMVFRGYSGISDGISHIALVGIATGLVLQLSPTLPALLITITLALLLEFLRHTQLVRGETAITIFVVFSLSLVSILQQTIGFTKPLSGLLFGSITSITVENIWWLVFIGSLTYVFILSNYRALLNLTFNQELARVLGFRVNLLNYILISLVAATVVVGIDIIGGLLISSLMILPIASAQQLGLGFRGTHLVAIIFAVVAVWLGLALSWFANLPAGATIALVSLTFFLLSLLSRQLTT